MGATRLMLSDARELQDEGVQAAIASVPDGERDAVPTGSIQAVKNWVKDDPDRAQRALDAENARDKPPRDQLVKHLEQVAGSGG